MLNKRYPEGAGSCQSMQGLLLHDKLHDLQTFSSLLSVSVFVLDCG